MEFIAMKFEPTGFNANVTVRAIRTKPFESFDAAVRSVIKSGREGYVKQLGQLRPVWNNMKVN